MNILQTKPALWKYKLTTSYLFLLMQYLYVLVFAENIDPMVGKHYLSLWYYDIALFFPVLFLAFFPQNIRIIIVSILFIGGLLYFYNDFGLNSIVFNTFISIFLANRFLLFKISDEQKDKIWHYRFLKILILFPLIFLAVIAETSLEYLGITHPIKYEDGNVMTNYGRFIMFGGFYGTLAYFSYKEERKSGNLNGDLV